MIQKTEIWDFAIRKFHCTVFSQNKTILIFFLVLSRKICIPPPFYSMRGINCNQVALYLDRADFSFDLLIKMQPIVHCCCQPSASKAGVPLFALKQIFNNLCLESPLFTIYFQRCSVSVGIGFRYRGKQNSLILSEIKTKTPSLTGSPRVFRHTHVISWSPE